MYFNIIEAICTIKLFAHKIFKYNCRTEKKKVLHINLFTQELQKYTIDFNTLSFFLLKIIIPTEEEKNQNKMEQMQLHSALSNNKIHPSFN